MATIGILFTLVIIPIVINMKLKYTILGLFLSLGVISFSQNQDKNQEYCRARQEIKSIDKIKSTFQVSAMSDHDKRDVMDFLYLKNRAIYNVKFDSQGNVIVYYLADISFKDIKQYLVEKGVYIKMTDSIVLP